MINQTVVGDISVAAAITDHRGEPVGVPLRVGPHRFARREVDAAVALDTAGMRIWGTPAHASEDDAENIERPGSQGSASSGGSVPGKRASQAPPPRSHAKPQRVSIDAMAASLQTSPFTRFRSPSELKDAVERIPCFDDTAELAAAVKAFLHEQIDVARDCLKNFLVLIGEHHLSHTSLALQMSAARAVRDKTGSGGTMMFEMQPKRVDGLKDLLGRFEELMPADLSVESINEADRKLQAKMDPELPAQKQSWITMGKVFASRQLGFRLAGFDTERESPRREDAMVEAIRAELRASDGPVIVVVGRRNLPPLHEQLQGQAHVISMVAVDEGVYRKQQTPTQILRHSYLLAKDGVLRVRGDTIDQASFGYARFADTLKIEIRRSPGDQDS